MDYGLGINECVWGFEIFKINELGRKLYLGKLCKDMAYCVWYFDPTHARLFKNKKTAEKIVSQLRDFYRNECDDNLKENKRMAKTNWNTENPDGDFSNDRIAYYHILRNIKAMVECINTDSKLKKDWWCKKEIGQDVAYIVAEHNDYSVRLIFEFADTGFCYVNKRYTDGSSYDDETVTSWNYAKKDDVEETFVKVVEILEDFFEKYN